MWLYTCKWLYAYKLCERSVFWQTLNTLEPLDEQSE